MEVDLNLTTRIESFFDRMLDIFFWVAGILLVTAMLTVSFDVIMRYFLNRPAMWSTEVCEYILLLIALFSAPWILREGGHVKVELLVSQFQPRTQALVGAIMCLLGAMVMAVIGWYAGETAWDNFQRGVPIAKTLQIPKAPLLVFISLSSFLLSIQFLRESCLNIRIVRNRCP